MARIVFKHTRLTSWVSAVALIGAMLSATGPAQAVTGGVVTEVTDPVTSGSSDPTYYGSNHRMIVTDQGREILVFGHHATGIKLKWKQTGALEWDGSLQVLEGEGTGDFPASIALTGAGGSEEAWVVYGYYGFGKVKPIR
ncbi:MAG: hypothetical protein H0V97_12480, partial [Actinobacteria bacterium]|nr:hypothetical protein [Actinomycetota bacterium]